jgi:hypothetical protein
VLTKLAARKKIGLARSDSPLNYRPKRWSSPVSTGEAREWCPSGATLGGRGPWARQRTHLSISSRSAWRFLTAMSPSASSETSISTSHLRFHEAEVVAALAVGVEGEGGGVGVPDLSGDRSRGGGSQLHGHYQRGRGRRLCQVSRSLVLRSDRATDAVTIFFLSWFSPRYSLHCCSPWMFIHFWLQRIK